MEKINKEKIQKIISDWINNDDNMWYWEEDTDYPYNPTHLEYWNDNNTKEDMIEDLTEYIIEEYEKRNN